MSQARIMIAGTGSGCGKTTVTCALMKAFTDAGERVVPFKCGPDYIDPMFHAHVTGQASSNLDSFFLDQKGLKGLMQERLQEGTLGIVEGVMGFFDGQGTGTHASSFEVACLTGTPVILVVDAKGMSLSLIALLEGFQNFAQKAGGEGCIKGVILNRCKASTCAYLKPVIQEQTGFKVYGYLEENPRWSLESRHLGLITAQEVRDLDERIARLGSEARTSFDLEAIRRTASQAPSLQEETLHSILESASVGGDAVLDQGSISDRTLRLAVAKDAAFCFYYRENLKLLETLGVQLIYFSPLKEHLPPEIDGLYLGGGYPELYAQELSQNQTLRKEIRQKCREGLPVLAECGGYLYLQEALEGFPMVGFLSGSARMTSRLGHFGYVFIQAEKGGLFGDKGFSFRGHEFHYSETSHEGGDLCVQKQDGRSWKDGIYTNTLYAAYPHLYFYSNIEAVTDFIRTMGGNR